MRKRAFSIRISSTEIVPRRREGVTGVNSQVLAGRDRSESEKMRRRRRSTSFSTSASGMGTLGKTWRIGPAKLNKITRELGVSTVTLPCVVPAEVATLSSGQEFVDACWQ